MTTCGELGVREAVASDADGVARVHVEAWRETYVGVLADHHFSETAFGRRRQFWTEYLLDRPRLGRMVVAECGGAVVGFANSGEARGPNAEHGFAPVHPVHLFSIYLLASAHGSGLGQSMLNAVLGDEPAQLWVLRGNERAIAFYARNGFVADGTKFVGPSDPKLVELRMVR